MDLHTLPAAYGSRKRRKIVGRGPGSGHGKTSCRGHKGQKSRAGRATLIGSEGGQMSLIRRLPKVGFRSKNPVIYQLVKIAHLNRVKEGTVVTVDFLKAHRLIKSTARPVKILGDGELKKPLTIHAHRFSKSAVEKITKVGGTAERIVKKQPAAA